jgi:hypothetical protein
MILKHKPYRNKKILKAAKGEDCLARFPGCPNNTETTVFCHLNESWAGKGMGIKADDCAGFFGCSYCHDIYDGRIKSYKLEPERVFQAYYRTIRRLLDLQILK